MLITATALFIAFQNRNYNDIVKSALAFASQSGAQSFEIQNTKPATIPTNEAANLLNTVIPQTESPKTHNAPSPQTSQTVSQSVQTSAEKSAQAQSKPVNEGDNISLSSSHVVIPSVGIDAPITWNVDGRDMDTYLPVLASSIAHYDWTPYPGNGGSTLLFGHSSYTKNLPNNFDEVFAPLFNMKNGDKVYVVYSGKLFTYEMYQSATIVPTNPEFISQNGPERVILMTCAPLGSQKYRLLVYAKRIP